MRPTSRLTLSLSLSLWTDVVEKFNFITEIFFLCLESNRLGFHRSILSYYDVNKTIRDMQSSYSTLESQRSSWTPGHMTMMNEQLLKNLKEKINLQYLLKTIGDLLLTDKTTLTHVGSLWEFTMAWIHDHVIDPNHQGQVSRLVKSTRETQAKQWPHGYMIARMLIFCSFA